MDEDDRERAFLTALTTEHFVLQSTRSTISSEAIGRAALYLGALSSALIALGFVVSRRAVFGPFLAAVLPVVVVLGLFTFLRVFQIGLEDVGHLQAMQRIRRYYRSLVPDGAHFFQDLTDEKDMVGDVERYMAFSMGVAGQSLLTAASAIAIINSMVAGAGIAVAVSALGVSVAVAVVAGVLAAIVFVALHLRYELKRVRSVL